MPDRVSSLDEGYVAGDLSLFPEAIDDKDSLYEVRNNAQTLLKQSLTYSAKNIVVEDASIFPPQGLLRIGPPAGEEGLAEIIYYGSRTNTVFTDTIRGFVGSRQNQWNAGSHVLNAVAAEVHNAIKDAIINIETYVGVDHLPAEGTVNDRLRAMEVKYLAPKAIFRSFPKKGPPPLKVRFQCLCSGDVVRYLWDFGDGGFSLERSPIHTFYSEGIFTIKLNVITSTGAQATTIKPNYITVSEDQALSFFYVVQADSSKPAYSVETAQRLVDTGENPSAVPATFNFVDQSEGNIATRIWVFGDGEDETVSDPNIHTTTHQYPVPGEYDPTLLLIFADERQRIVLLDEPVVVI
jgi:PKD repeat protein